MTKQIKKLSEILGPPLKLRITTAEFKETILDTSEKALLYLDPPYYTKGNDLYQCAFTLDDHIRLALALRDTKHKWLLSYDDCPEVRALYKWATIEPLSVKYSITTARTKSELLIYPK
jgi:DNA adenine methylase